MNENINLCEILKGHEGETFYSPIFGYVTLIEANSGTDYPIQVLPIDCNIHILQFSNNGKFWGEEYPNGECMLFPSKDQRDWNKWVEEQKSKTPKTWSEIEHCNVEVFEAMVHLESNGPCNPICKSVLALLKIHQLIEIGYGGNVTDHNEPQSIILWDYRNNKLYSENFQKVFKCGSLIRLKIGHVEEFLSYPENVQLLKDYFMIN